MRRGIVGDAVEHLRPGGSFIQFTYVPVAPVEKILRDEPASGRTRSEAIRGDAPPATSHSFHRREAARRRESPAVGAAGGMTPGSNDRGKLQRAAD